ncbi:DUF1269 domain-containing protein [Ornithinimicrobium sp. F0845]|uniref:DUF1269 domain-containing protein n=1 Tax=Ornithinimicrobium sp. F0845 TaxID=2926412 RepID=UPI001FF5AB9E|nr:DUF1269 domain-containing protein [Ornithinimicrobium sp. F0845]MCK0112980.1 DUF1269 domain-containing protein [Ornithinimicrobium sp. F0845]
MSELIIIGYDDHATADRAYQKVLQLQRDFVVALNGLATVHIDDEGKKHVEMPQKIVGASAAAGGLWGVLIGILFLAPGLGLLVGGAVGALSGKLSKVGINKAFRERVEGLLEPGSAAVVIMASKITEDKFNAAMSEFGGTVLQTSLSEEDESELAAELAGSDGQ